MTQRMYSVPLLCLALSLSGPASSHESENPGNVQFQISCNKEAQQAFNRALAMLHNFWFPEAGNAFAEVATADPTCAMAYWGTAISARSNPLVGAPSAAAMKRGWEQVEKAKAARAITSRERDYVAALERYYQDPDSPDFRSRVLAYEKGMEELYLRYPDDIEAAVLYALALNEAVAVAPADKTYARQLKAATITEKVLTRQPGHPGALHYLIHSYDFPALAVRGMTAARLYASAAPSAPHALHMPSHVYSMLGMWQESIESNRSALGVAKSYVHAMDFMVYAYLQMGQDREAERLMNEAFALQKAAGSASTRSPTGAVLTVHTAYAAIPARYVLERGAWAEAGALDVQPRSPAADAITHFVRAMGLARTGDVVSALSAIDKLRALRDELASAKDDYWSQQVEIQRRAATAWVEHAQGDKAKAVTLMRSAANLEDASEKHVAMENRLWPMRELLGELLLELGEAEQALREFETSLQEARNRLRGYYGAAVAAEKVGQQEKAAVYYQKLLTLTGNAGAERPEIKQAKAYLAAR